MYACCSCHLQNKASFKFDRKNQTHLHFPHLRLISIEYLFEFILGTFEDSEITHVEGEVDPVRDLDIINEELRLKDVEYFDKV